MITDILSEAEKRKRRYKSISQCIYFFAFVLCSLSIFVMIITTDITPATYDDYTQLNEKLLALQENPSSLLKQEGILEVSEDGIYYTVENSQCKMTGEYDLDYKLINTFQEDKYTPGILVERAIIIITFFGFTSFGLNIVLNIFITPIDSQPAKTDVIEENDDQKS